jgi:hypothetical protein
MDEPLVGMDNAGEINASLGVFNQLCVCPLRNNDRECRWRNQVRVPQVLRGFHLEVRRMRCLNSPRELPDFLTAYGVGFPGRINAAGQLRVDPDLSWISFSRAESLFKA